MANELLRLWHAHRQDPLPEVPSECKGELWVLDEVIGGCVSYCIEAGQRLDSPRAHILEDCREDLRRLLPELEGPAITYFSRLGALAELLLAAYASDANQPQADR
jgi:hypothetical protein